MAIRSEKQANRQFIVFLSWGLYDALDFWETDNVMMNGVNNTDKGQVNSAFAIGRIVKLDEIDQEVVIQFDSRGVVYDFNELDEVALSYATTVHKSQGSEYPAVVMPIHTQHYALLQRNLLYTAITRGRKLVVLVGSRKAVSIAVRRMESRRRVTLLKEQLIRKAGLSGE